MIPVRNGPLIVRGRLRVLDPSSGGAIAEETRWPSVAAARARTSPSATTPTVGPTSTSWRPRRARSALRQDHPPRCALPRASCSSNPHLGRPPRTPPALRPFPARNRRSVSVECSQLGARIGDLLGRLEYRNGAPERAPRACHARATHTSPDGGVALVDERDLDLIGRLLGQPGRQLEAAEPGTEDQDTPAHAQRGCGTMRM